MDATSPYDKGKNVLEKRDQANEEEDVIGDLMAVMDKHKGKFEKNDRKSGDFMLYGDVDDDDADDTLEMKALMPEDYALDADERNKKGSGSRDAHSPGRNQLDSSEKPMASIENAGKTTTGRSGSVCRLCQGFPKIVIDAEGSRAFVHRVSESIGEYFPKIPDPSLTTTQNKSCGGCFHRSPRSRFWSTSRAIQWTDKASSGNSCKSTVSTPQRRRKRIFWQWESI